MITNMAGKNILILGHSGFVGRALVRRLKETGDNLFLASKDGGGEQGDLKDKNFCERILKDIDIVYYLAGCKKNIAFHMAEPFYFFTENVLPLTTFLDALKNSKAKKIIYLSSIIINYINSEEKDGYILGKYANELMLKTFAAQFPQIETVVLRSAPIYGPGDNFDAKTANFIPSMINKVAASEKAVEVWGTGKRKMQFIYIEDLIDNLIAASGASNGVYNIGNNEAAAVSEIAETIIKKFGKQLILEFNATMPDKATNLAVFNNLSAPAYNLERGLDKTIKYFQENIL